MAIDQILSASIANGAVVPADLSTGAPTWDASGNLTPSGQIRGTASGTPPLLADSAGNTATCRAWGSYAYVASGSTPTLRGSFNLSSITRNAAGTYTFAFTTSMPDTNYSAFILPSYSAQQAMVGQAAVKNTGSVQMYVGYASSLGGAFSFYDYGIDFCIFR